MRAVETTPAGKYRVRFRRVDPDTRKAKQTSETFATKREAERFSKLLDALGVERALDALYAGKVLILPTLNDLANEHFENLSGVTVGTVETYRRLWDRTWGPLLGARRLDEIGDDQISKALKTLGQKYSLKSLKNQRGLLTSVLDRGVRREYIAKNPASGVRLPHGQASRGNQDMRILSVEEFMSVQENIPEHYRPLVRFMWATGCRWGEAIALQGQDIRWPNVHISRALKYAPARADRTIGPTKNRQARTVQLSPELHAELIALKAAVGPTGLMFPNKSGNMLESQHFYEKIWRPATAHLEIRPRIHDLRHSHASELLARGVPIHIVSARLGHSSIKITVDVYGHLQPDAQKWAAEAAGLAFRAPPEPPALSA